MTETSAQGAEAVNVLKIGPWGGKGGRAWEWDGPVQRIIVKHGDVVDSLTFEASRSGTTTMWSERFGGPDGGSSEISLDPGEYLTAISGTTGLYYVPTYIITSLTFHSNKKKYGPFGRETKNQFSTPTEGWEIVGFFGRCGAWMDEIGIKLVPIIQPKPSPQISGLEKDFIFMVSQSTKALNPAAYTPTMVSIGPYHHGHSQLSNMEEHKKRAFENICKRSKKTYQHFSNELRKLLPLLRGSYQQLNTDWNSNDEMFLELMIYDGAFLGEYCRCLSHSNNNATDYPDNDQVFGYHAAVRNSAYIIQDIVMIENQLPFKVLERMAAVMEGRLDEEHYPALFGLVFILLGQPPAPLSQATQCMHILDVARLVITKDAMGVSSCTNTHAGRVPSASDLSNVGVQFIEHGGQIEFIDSNLYLAPLKIDTFTKTLFLNCITFEKLRPSVGGQVSSYITFMAGLIRSGADVGLLKSRHLLINPNEGDDEVSRLISTISEGVSLDPFSYLCEVRMALNQYYDKQMKSVKQGVRKWTQKVILYTLSGAGGAAILLLTAIQTFYTVYTYYKKK